MIRIPEHYGELSPLLRVAAESVTVVRFWRRLSVSSWAIFFKISSLRSRTAEVAQVKHLLEGVFACGGGNAGVELEDRLAQAKCQQHLRR